VQALGVRYVAFQTRLEGDETRSPPEDAILRRDFGPATVGGREVTYTVYEYSGTNLGNYSPTNVVIARDAPSILQHLWKTSFDPRRSIILPERIEEPLVQATGGKMSFERGAIRVQAETHGHSLLLLPLQYSRCLVVSEAAKAKLLPANLVQTAVLFQGSIDLRIILNIACSVPRVARRISPTLRNWVFSTRSTAVWIGPNYIHMPFRLSPICHALWGQSSRSLRPTDDNCQTLAAAADCSDLRQLRLMCFPRLGFSWFAS
jgi:hypothetical protein